MELHEHTYLGLHITHHTRSNNRRHAEVYNGPYRKTIVRTHASSRAAVIDGRLSIMGAIAARLECESAQWVIDLSTIFAAKETRSIRMKPI